MTGRIEQIRITTWRVDTLRDGRVLDQRHFADWKTAREFMYQVADMRLLQLKEQGLRVDVDKRDHTVILTLNSWDFFMAGKREQFLMSNDTFSRDIYHAPDLS